MLMGPNNQYDEREYKLYKNAASTNTGAIILGVAAYIVGFILGVSKEDFFGDVTFISFISNFIPYIIAGSIIIDIGLFVCFFMETIADMHRYARIQAGNPVNPVINFSTKQTFTQTSQPTPVKADGTRNPNANWFCPNCGRSYEHWVKKCVNCGTDKPNFDNK